MNQMSRFLAILLAFAMLIPCFSITALADDMEPNYNYYEPATDTDLYDRYINNGKPNNTGYIAFGDSVARGYGLDNFFEPLREGYTIDDTDDPNCRIVHDSYPYLIAREILRKESKIF